MPSSPPEDALAPVEEAWNAPQVVAYLDDTVIPLRLSFLDPDGHPRLLSLWFVYRDGHLWCAMRPSAVVARAVGRDGRVSVEIADDEVAIEITPESWYSWEFSGRMGADRR